MRRMVKWDMKWNINYWIDPRSDKTFVQCLYNFNNNLQIHQSTYKSVHKWYIWITVSMVFRSWTCAWSTNVLVMQAMVWVMDTKSGIWMTFENWTAIWIPGIWILDIWITDTYLLSIWMVQLFKRLVFGSPLY